jgi:AcrR family transcriptional regulator
MDQVLKIDGTSEATDPRIMRSRRMLMEALAKLLSHKEFNDISIQEIADEATLNRATFYLHYPDKNALLQAMTAARFRELIARRGLAFSDCDDALRAIALGVCDHLAETTGCPTQLAKMSLEGSIIPVVEDIFLEGQSNHPVAAGIDHELLATTVASAIFGAARRWYQTPNRVPAEEIASRIAAMVKPMLLAASASAPGRISEE